MTFAMSIITSILLVLVIQAIAGIIAGVLTFRLLGYVDLGIIKFIHDRNATIGQIAQMGWKVFHYFGSIAIFLLVAWSFKIGWSIVAIIVIISAISRYGVQYSSQENN